MHGEVSLPVGRNIEKVRSNGAIFGRNMQCLKRFSEHMPSPSNKLSILFSRVQDYIFLKSSKNFSMKHVCYIKLRKYLQNSVFSTNISATRREKSWHMHPCFFCYHLLVIVNISMRSLVSIEQQSPRRPCEGKMKAKLALYNAILTAHEINFLTNIPFFKKSSYYIYHTC